MKRKYRSKKIRIVGAVVFLALMIFSSVFVIWQMKTNEFGGLIDRIEEVFYGTPFKNAYNAKSLILVDLSNDEVFISKRENEQQLPASLAKLFVIKYAVTLADLDSIVSANYEAISLTKSGSSVANYADLNPVVGSEQGGTRPVLVISNDIGNKHSPTVIIAAITSRVRKKKKLPTHLYLGQIEGLPANSIILFEQLRTIDKSRLKEHLTHLDEQYLKSLEFPLLISIGVEKRRSL